MNLHIHETVDLKKKKKGKRISYLLAKWIYSEIAENCNLGQANYGAL